MTFVITLVSACLKSNFRHLVKHCLKVCTLTHDDDYFGDFHSMTLVSGYSKRKGFLKVHFLNFCTNWFKSIFVVMTLVSGCCKRKGFLRVEAFEALDNSLLLPPHQQTWTWSMWIINGSKTETNYFKIFAFMIGNRTWWVKFCEMECFNFSPLEKAIFWLTVHNLCYSGDRILSTPKSSLSVQLDFLVD